MDELRSVFREFAAAFGPAGSPLYARLSLALAERPEVLGLLAAARPEQRLPLLLFAAVHHEVLRHGVAYPADPDAFADFCAEHAQALRELLATRRTQTNEVGRCGFLLPCLSRIPGPLGLIEVGASAGLNLNLDRYAYRYGSVELGDSAVRLEPELRGRAPATGIPRVVSRIGVDLAPAPDPDWLRACVWPDQPERLARLNAALAIAAEHPVELVQGDALELLPSLIAAAQGTVVVFHTAVGDYLSAEQEEQLLALVRDVHHVSAETHGDLAAFTLSVDGQVVGRAHPHGTWLEWRG